MHIRGQRDRRFALKANEVSAVVAAAIASTTPEPQIPTASPPPIVVTTRPPLSIPTRSIAPSAARMPQATFPPSSAGPEGHETDSARPPETSEISVLVPMSITSVAPPWSHSAPVASNAATWSEPTKPPTPGAA
jgi:hypothetical protein